MAMHGSHMFLCSVNDAYTKTINVYYSIVNMAELMSSRLRKFVLVWILYLS